MGRYLSEAEKRRRFPIHFGKPMADGTILYGLCGHRRYSKGKYNMTQQLKKVTCSLCQEILETKHKD